MLVTFVGQLHNFARRSGFVKLVPRFPATATRLPAWTNSLDDERRSVRATRAEQRAFRAGFAHPPADALLPLRRKPGARRADVTITAQPIAATARGPPPRARRR